jgi:mannose/fructose-specific phosphotransferase system component IIA
VTGVNLPMLLAAIELRSDGLEAMTAAARAAGIDGIRNARESLPAVKAETT